VSMSMSTKGARAESCIGMSYGSSIGSSPKAVAAAVSVSAHSSSDDDSSNGDSLRVSSRVWSAGASKLELEGVGDRNSNV
jgi:hypothetical protein